MVIHIITLILVTLVLSGFVIYQENIAIKNEVFVVVDLSSSSVGNKAFRIEKVTQIV